MDPILSSISAIISIIASLSAVGLVYILQGLTAIANFLLSATSHFLFFLSHVLFAISRSKTLLSYLSYPFLLLRHLVAAIWSLMKLLLFPITNVISILFSLVTGTANLVGMIVYRLQPIFTYLTLASLVGLSSGLILYGVSYVIITALGIGDTSKTQPDITIRKPTKKTGQTFRIGDNIKTEDEELYPWPQEWHQQMNSSSSSTSTRRRANIGKQRVQIPSKSSQHERPPGSAKHQRTVNAPGVVGDVDEV